MEKKSIAVRLTGLLVAVAFVLGLAYRSGLAAYPDPDRDAGVYNIISNGLRVWSLQGTSTSLTVSNKVTTTAARQTNLTVDAVTGAIKLQGYTSAELSTLAPPAAGYIVFNTSVNTPCVSTGTGNGAWITPLSTQTATLYTGLRPQCY